MNYSIRIYNFKHLGYVHVPFSGNKVEILVYPICSIKCRGQMIGNRAESGYIKPDSEAFRSLFPALYCQLICGGRPAGQFNCRVSITNRPRFAKIFKGDSNK